MFMHLAALPGALWVALGAYFLGAMIAVSMWRAFPPLTDARNAAPDSRGQSGAHQALAGSRKDDIPEQKSLAAPLRSPL